MEKNINFIVQQEENNSRVDILINQRERLISRTRIKNLILKDKLKLNNIIINNPSKKVNAGDQVALEIPKPKSASLKPFDFKLDIIHEDDDLMVINKPAGIIMQGYSIIIPVLNEAKNIQIIKIGNYYMFK